MVGEGGLVHNQVDVGKALLTDVGMHRAGGNRHHIPLGVADRHAVPEGKAAAAAGAVHQLPVVMGVGVYRVRPGMLPHKGDVVHIAPP